MTDLANRLRVAADMRDDHMEIPDSLLLREAADALDALEGRPHKPVAWMVVHPKEPHVAGEAVAWLIPSSSGREPNDRGFIDAMAWSDGEFTMPVYTHPAPKADAAAPDGWSVTEDAANNRIHFSIGVQTFTLDWVPDEQPETRRPWMAGMLRKALTRLAAAPPAPPAAEARAKSDLYYAVNEMMAHLGAAGEIDTRHRSVTKVMAELERIDSGAPDNATATNAERYLFLRERDLDSISNGGVFAGLTPKNVVLNGDDLDRAIDAAMSGSKGAT